MKTIVVLAMHGSPPVDFPRKELSEFFRLHTQMKHKHEPGSTALKQRYLELDAKMRSWPRNETNDPFFVGAQNMALHLRKSTELDVIVGYNEFCAPSLDEAIDEAAVNGAKRIIIITPMMTRGGEHSEKDIPDSISRSQKRHTDIELVYAWPIDHADVADFLSSQIKKFV
jgi:sirohydrochlorin cobaltochelatase